MKKMFFHKTQLSVLLILVCCGVSVAQARYQLANSSIMFFSEAPLENIEAKNKDTKGIIDISARSFTIRVPIKSFVFEKGLMQEHFNENYMESDKYPNATFKGAIDGTYDLKKNGSYPVTAAGELDIHGVKQKRTIQAIIEVKNKSIKLTSKFKVRLEDHKIEIPTLVFNKIAEELDITLESELINM
jgi:polyisoprenoid-binding protein YceI